ncbi:unnamed protein product, partial [Ectocarpus sp. 12 AP-2014]
MRNPTRFLPLILIVFLAACGGESPGGGEKIREFTSGMHWEAGFVPVYRDDRQGKVYLLLDEQLGDFLYQSSLPRGVGSNDIGLDRGQLGGRAALVSFEVVGDKALLKRRNLRYRADSENPDERRAVEHAFASAVVWGFPVVARDGGQVLVDATDFMLRDSHGVTRRLKEMGEGDFKVDASRSAIHAPRIKAFPKNTELESIVTLSGENPGPHLRSVAADPH